jgi:energy-coupling factor transporter ATP-binding protein EcfA2
VLKDFSLNVPTGSICALLGPTNSGKTTLLQSIAGVLGSHNHEAIATGSIRVGNEVCAPLPRRIMFPAVGLTLQDPFYQISGFRNSVLEEISLTLETLDLPESEMQSRVVNLLDTVGLSHLSLRKPSTLSGGELQRVALANILVAQPHVLLLDEPCNSLDGVAQRRLAKIICSLRKSTTVLIGDYQLEFAMHTADQFVVLDGGKIAFAGDRSQFLDNLPTFRSLLPVEVLERSLGTLTGSVMKKRIMRMLGNR